VAGPSRAGENTSVAAATYLTVSSAT
jgi:hypothetical protein